MFFSVKTEFHCQNSVNPEKVSYQIPRTNKTLSWYMISFNFAPNFPTSSNLVRSLLTFFYRHPPVIAHSLILLGLPFPEIKSTDLQLPTRILPSRAPTFRILSIPSICTALWTRLYIVVSVFMFPKLIGKIHWNIFVLEISNIDHCSRL